MRVFISWSGERSRALGAVFAEWLPLFLHAVTPYFSPDDVVKGTRWYSEIAQQLENCHLGLLILTPANRDAPWLHFEAGALSKSLHRSKVCPILFDGLEPTDLKGPLAQLEHTRFEEHDMRRLFKMIWAEMPEKPSEKILDPTFDTFWPRFALDIREALDRHGAPQTNVARTERDMLEEVLSLTRSLTQDDSRSHSFDFDSKASWELCGGLEQLLRLTSSHAPSDRTLTDAVLRLLSGFRSLSPRLPPTVREELQRIADRMSDPGSSTSSESTRPNGEEVFGFDYELFAHDVARCRRIRVLATFIYPFAKTESEFYAAVGQKLLAALREALGRSTFEKAELLFLNPRSDAARLRDQERSGENIIRRTEESLETLHGLQQELDKQAGAQRPQIKVFSRTPAFSLFQWDRQGSFSFYFRDRKISESARYKFFMDSRFGRFVEKAFEDLWDDPGSTFLADYYSSGAH